MANWWVASELIWHEAFIAFPKMLVDPCRHKYKYYPVEVLLELVLPMVIVGIGCFASGTALKTVNFNCLNGC